MVPRARKVPVALPAAFLAVALVGCGGGGGDGSAAAAAGGASAERSPAHPAPAPPPSESVREEAPAPTATPGAEETSPDAAPRTEPRSPVLERTDRRPPPPAQLRREGDEGERKGSAAAPPDTATAAPDTTGPSEPAPARAREGEAPPALRTDREPPPPPPDFAGKGDVVEIPRGTTLSLLLEETLSTEANRPGDTFTATLVDDLLASDGMVLLPGGVRFRGRVTESRESPAPGEPAVLGIAVESLVLDGVRMPVEATVVHAEPAAESRDSDRETAGKVAAGAAAGAILGRILGRSAKDALKGAVAGALAGTAVALATREGHAVLREGSVIVVRLEEPLRIPER